ncbi:MAG: hypothetical protein WCC57_11990 [Paracoccaceae bacterium]
MATENTSKTIQALTADYDAVVEQLAALREEMAKLAVSMNATATHRSQALAKDVTDGVNEALRYMGRKGHDADARVEDAVAANPYIALGLAAGMGLLLGALTRR